MICQSTQLPSTPPEKEMKEMQTGEGEEREKRYQAKSAAIYLYRFWLLACNKKC